MMTWRLWSMKDEFYWLVRFFLSDETQISSQLHFTGMFYDEGGSGISGFDICPLESAP
jgi:hypothetical protein